MSLKFPVGAASKLNTSAFPVASPPMTFGFWHKNGNPGGIEAIFTVMDAAATKRLHIFAFNDNTLALNDSSIGSVAGGSSSTSLWRYFLLRFRATDDKKLDILNGSGEGSLVQLSQTTGSGAPVFDTAELGGNVFGEARGMMGEFWYTNTDIAPGITTLSAAFVRQLAYRGPFSVPYIRKDIIEYHSFFSRTVHDKWDEVYYGKYGRQTWTNTNGVTIGPHPPAAQNYVRPHPSDNNVFIYQQDTPAVTVTGNWKAHSGFLVNPGSMMNL